MEYLPPVGWGDVATKHDLDQLAVLTKRDIEHFAVLTRLELDRMADRFDGRIATALQAQTNRMVTWMIALWTTSVAVSVGAAIAVGR